MDRLRLARSLRDLVEFAFQWFAFPDGQTNGRRDRHILLAECFYSFAFSLELVDLQWRLYSSLSISLCLDHVDDEQIQSADLSIRPLFDAIRVHG